MKTFHLTSDHLKLLNRFYIGWDDCEYGAPAIDCKRPYGNSDVEADICEILEWKPEESEDDGLWSAKQREQAATIHADMQTVLQICCLMAGKAVVECGLYIQGDKYDDRSWKRVGS